MFPADANGMRLWDKVWCRVRAGAEGIYRSPAKVWELLKRALQRAGQYASSFSTETMDDLSTSIRMVSAWARGEYVLPKEVIILIISGLLYLVLFFDLVPDAIPVAGLVDDAAVLTYIFKIIRDWLDRFREWERTRSSNVT
jgi:uncharacterized membrane protein YkvA (DUF1232 family)